ncbi:hypothetical protein GCM10010116_36670 [Microbispora rosea subsp. aerata]|nr:hypothetical protein [Microbispora rosea]GGO18214.1 hypothetical protein GCM10010116_36670 [Microbispora rosea subsp. aerata]GIH56697.1 hypothetical protein Mro02_36110 [Microbispora rosea subsp. aerata]GLJ82070.1 hypothetical protein GCM10017588_07950 [Microbispora rosea subsp. aerata]
MRERGLTGRTIWAPLAAAALSGLIIGGLARLLMRGIQLAIGGPTEMSPVGTAAIVVAFGVLALPAAATATARPAIMHGGRWATALVTGQQTARTGLGDAKTILLADDSRLLAISLLIVAFAAIVVAHGRLAQHLTRRFRQLPASRAEAVAASRA